MVGEEVKTGQILDLIVKQQRLQIHGLGVGGGCRERAESRTLQSLRGIGINGIIESSHVGHANTALYKLPCLL